ncbi:MAG: HAD-IA family hydrolase [Pseudomonadota bacterium]|nr:HAD-IA family hydrolase [Pseudomonadota bacterium]
MSDLKLVVFDVDGTLIDSQGLIMAAMTLGFEKQGLAAPAREDVLPLVGLSLEIIMPRLASAQSPAVHAELVDGYKNAFMELRKRGTPQDDMPLFDGALAAVSGLHAQPETLLGIATGKSRRGLDKVLQAYDMERYFFTQQVADHHPSKPHPSMLSACLADTGASADQAVMIGDTSFDMDMAKAAGFKAIGVSWGYHDRNELAAADIVIDRFTDLENALEELWR